MQLRARAFLLTGVTLALLAGAEAAGAVTMDWVRVGAAGNAADSTGFGAVGVAYQISRYEVTNTQYAEFLNSVAAEDPRDLWNPNMELSQFGGIARSEGADGFSYDVKPGFANKPVNYVSFYDALRFANWLHNGQPAGAQNASTTENGAYTLTAGGILNNSITRNPDAIVFLTSEDEWYKAAYYDPDTAGYFDYPAGMDDPVTCALPGPGANMGNCDVEVGTLTDAGSYLDSESPFGSFDQGGNVWEWNETILGSNRGLRGGSWFFGPADLSSAVRFLDSPAFGSGNVGFRVAMVPEPRTGLLVMAGLLGLAHRRRRSA